MPFKAFLKLEGIDGQSPDKAHEKWIELEGFSHAMTQLGSFGRDGQLTGGTADVHEFSIQKQMDKASPLICEKLASGAKIDKATVHLVSAIGAETSHIFAKYEFTPCVIASYSIAGGAGGTDKPTESISLRFSIVRWEFTPYDGNEPGTAVRTGWDTARSIKDTTKIS